MLEYPKPKELSLKEIIKNDFNKGVYNFYHEVLEKEYNIKIDDLKGFFNTLYDTSSLFYYNYEHLPHEVNSELLKQIKNTNDKDHILSAFKFTLLFLILTIITSKITNTKEGKKELDYNEYFDNNERWTYQMEIFGELHNKAQIEISRMTKKEIDFTNDFSERLYKYTNNYFGNPVKTIELQDYFFEITNENNLVEASAKINISASEKIIYLEKLGIINFLKEQEPFISSTNLFAKALSFITGEKQSTMQSYLNPMLSKTSNQKNNPLSNLKKVEIAKEQLINIGYKQPN